jgi:glycosyltransferase involved in cell wall biosynthesis
MVKVLHFCESFSPLSETFVYDYITELERQGVDNHVVTLERENPADRPFPKVTEIGRAGRWHPHRLWHRALASFGIGEIETAGWPVMRSRLAKVVREVKPDVIHSHFGHAGVWIAPVADAADVPLVVSFYGFDVSILAQRDLWKKKYPKAFEVASLLIGISNHICSRVEALGGAPRKIECSHLGVNLEGFEYQPADQSYDGRTVTCLHVGRLVEKKAPIELAQSFEYACRRSDPDVGLELKIAGGGPLRSELEQEIEDLHIGDKVSLLGAVPHEKVSELMTEANIYTQHCKTASNGDQEGQGVSFVEASASGLPIVSTHHNGIPDVVLDGKTGYLVEEKDTKAMGEVIASLAETPNDWVSLGRAGRAHVEKNFDLKRQVKSLVEKLSYIS